MFGLGLQLASGAWNLVIRGILISVLTGASACAQDAPDSSRLDLDQAVTILVNGSQSDCEFALVEIAKHGPEARVAVSAVCRHLHSSSFSVRSLASDALVAIGPESVAALRKLLKVNSPITRSSVLQTLGRLKAISLEELAEYSKDHEPRVKSAVAIAIRMGEFKDANESIANLLIQLLEDEEQAVLVQACLALQVYRVSPETIVPALVESMKQKRQLRVLVHTISRYGIDAQEAIPFLIEYSSEFEALGEYFKGFDEELERIGPPSLNDVEKLLGLVGNDDFERSRRALDAIGRLGPRGRSTAPRLAEIVTRFTEQGAVLKKLYDQSADEDREKYSRYYDCAWAAKSGAVAFWNVSRDSKRFVELVEGIQLAFDGEIYFPRNLVYENPWERFSRKDALEISGWLSSGNPILVGTALHAIDQMGPNGDVHVDQLIKLLSQGQVATDSWLTPADSLKNLGVAGAEKALPALIESVKAEETTFDELAAFVFETGVSNDEAAAMFRRGMSNGARIKDAARALCNTATDADDFIRLFVKSAKLLRLDNSDGTYVLNEMERVPASALAFAESNLMHKKYNYPVASAIELLGKIGPPANRTVDAIREHLGHRQFDVRLGCAVSLYQIAGDADTLIRVMKDELKNPSNRVYERTKVIQKIADLGDQGKTFRFLVWENEDYFVDHGVRGYCNVLASIGDETAIESLQRVAQSKNWVARVSARDALNSLQESIQ